MERSLSLDRRAHRERGVEKEWAMKVIDLPPDKEELYCQCLEEWSDEIKEAGSLKREWYERMRSRGLRVKVCLDENGAI